MYGAVKHIEQTFPRGEFSRIYYASSSPAGVVDINFAQQNVSLIFTHYIYWNPTNSGVPATFTDQYKLNLFSFVDTGLIFLWAPLFQTMEGTQLRITCSIPAVTFSVSYQYIL